MGYVLKFCDMIGGNYLIALLFFSIVVELLLLPFSIISLLLSLFNMIPIDTLDGGRMLRCAVSHIFSLDTADTVMKISTLFALITLWSFSVYLMLKTVSGLTLFVFSAILFKNLFISGDKKRE